MFTGIVEEVGRIASIRRGAHSCELVVEARVVLDGVKRGDSIATNGVCLTVTSFSAASFTADVMHETLSRSSLSTVHPGALVNLERAMSANGRFGGHIVTGHIDATGTIKEIVSDDNAVWYRIAAEQRVMRSIVEKGSIAIDGISLTVARVDAPSFGVSVIPHTQEETTLTGKPAGEVVNLENDMIVKYVEKLMKQPQKGLSLEFLQANGF